MALTQRSGVLGQVQQQAAQTARTVATTANAALNLLNQQRVPATAPRPVVAPAPAPVRQLGVSSGTAPQWRVIPGGGGGSAAAAQQVLRAAQARQQSAPSLLDTVARNAIATALAVATGQTPARSGPTVVRDLNRMAPAGATQGMFAPERESQIFDQQIQMTKYQANPTAWLDPAYTQRLEAMGRDLAAMQRPPMPIQSPRVIREQRALQLFPQNDPLYIRTLTDDQLDALISLGENPQPIPAASGAADQVTAGAPKPNEMTRGVGAPVDAEQYRYPANLNVDAQQYRYPIGPPTGWANGYPTRGGTQAVTSAMNQVIDRTSAGRTEQGGGGFFDTVGNVIDAGQEIGGDLLSAGETLVGGAWGALSGLSVGDAIGALTSAASGTYESFLESSAGQIFVQAMTQLDRLRGWNVQNIGGLAYRTATKSPFMGPGDWNEDHYISLFPPLALAFEAAYRLDPELEAEVIGWHDNGYSSPAYLAQLEAKGIDPSQVGPQFTGDRAVWEGLIGKTDNLPPVLKYPIRITVDALTDPLSMGPQIATVGRGAAKFGAAMRGLEGAGTGTKVAGTLLEGAGRGIEIGARAPDAPFEAGATLVRKGGGKVGEVTGLFSPSSGSARDAAALAGHQMDEALTAGRASIPDEPARVAFDAEAQGVTPASGPRLISDVTPPASAVPPVRQDTPQAVAPSVVRADTADLDRRIAELEAILKRGDTQERILTAAAPNDPDDFVSIPTRVQRFEEAGKAATTADKPQGLYTSPANVISPHADLGGDPVFYRTNPNANVLTVRTGFVRTNRGMVGESAGLAALREILGEDEVARLVGLSESDLRRELQSSHPDIDWGRFTDAQEMIEAHAGIVSRAAGYDAIWAIDEAAPEFNEYVALTDTALQPDRPDAPISTSRFTTNEVGPAAVELGRLKRERLRRIQEARASAPTQAERDAAAATGSAPDTPRTAGARETIRAAESSRTGTISKRHPMSAGDRATYGRLAKAVARQKRMAKEDARGLPKKVNEILREQKPGEHEFSPVYGGHRPLDRIVTKAIDSKDPAQMAKAEALVKRVDDAVEKHLRPDAFHRTWKRGGAPVKLQSDPRFTDEFFEAMRAIEPDADAFRLKVLANGLAKGVLDDIAELQFQLNHLFPMIAKDYPDEFRLDGLLGSVGRIESRDFRAESAEWLIREYLDTPDPAQAETILLRFLTGATEMPVIADGVHVPYAHAIPADYHAESIARLRQMRKQWIETKRNPMLAEELSDAQFREADVAAQFDGGLKGPSKALAAAAQATKPKLISDEAALLAIGEIKDPEITRILLKGDGKMTAEIARGLDRAMPAGWTAPGYKGPKTEWNVKEALDWVNEYAEAHPGFDRRRAIDDIGQLAAGLQPRLSRSELASARRAAKANGLDPSAVKDGATAMERATATKAVRGLDWYLKHYRAVRLFNPIVGLPNRLGDIVGNAMALMIGRNPWGAAKLFPMTFTEAKAFRSLGRDTRKLVERWAIDTPHMAETGMPYPDTLLRYSKLQDAGLTDMLPPVNKAVAGTPRAVRTVASLWTTPALKDVMVASEMTGRKLTFDRMYTSIVKREGIPAFRDELRNRYGDGADAIYERILAEAQDKAGRSYTGLFSPGDVLAVTGDAQLQRMWQRTLNNASERGVKEADHLFFSGGTTNADEITRRTLTFHYWMVRASALYGRTLLRNPVLLSGFFKIYQEAQRIGEEQGLPDWLNGMMKFYQIPGNATGYAAMDPIGVLFPTFFMDAYSQEGNKFQALQNLLIPPVSAALGALGLTQNVPNPTGTKGIERFVIDMGNFLKGEGVDLESIPGFGKFIDNDSLTLTIPSEEFTAYLIGAANTMLERAGVSFGDFQPFDRQANEEDQLFSIGQQIAMQLYGPDIEKWTPEQVAELAAAVHQAQYGDGEETWLSETIRSNFGREGGARALGALVIPGGVVTRQTYRDEQMALSREYWDAFFSGKPTTKEGESAAAGRQMVTAANPVWAALNEAYHAIGTETQQQQHKLFYNMLLSPDRLNPNQSIILDNGDGTYTFYTMRQLAGMEQDDREKVVYAWLDSHPEVKANVEFVKTGRDAFKDAHPDYAQYTTYQRGVYDYPGGISQFRRDMRDNDAFREAEDAERARLKKEGKSGSVLEAELDQWATSQEAYFAAAGIPYKRGDTVDKTPGPSSVAAMFSLRPDPEKAGGSKKSDSTNETPKDPRIDDYWSPEKGVPRLQQDLAQYEYDNQKMEQRFGDAWNEQTGDWEDHADSAKERKELGIYGQTFYTPSVTETMKRYEEWEQMNPGGTPEEFFTEMLNTEGFGIKVGAQPKAAPKLPGGTVVTPPARSSVAAATGLLQGRVTNVPSPGSRPKESTAAQEVVKVAESYVGQVPYVWGGIPGKGQDPSGGWDCSGMVYWLDQNYGSGQIPMGSHYQYQYAVDTGKLFTDMSQLQPGDIVFLDTGWYGGAGGNLNAAGHVGIYAGNGQLIQATNASQGTVIQPLDAYGTILGAMHGTWK